MMVFPEKVSPLICKSYVRFDSYLLLALVVKEEYTVVLPDSLYVVKQKSELLFALIGA